MLGNMPVPMPQDENDQTEEVALEARNVELSVDEDELAEAVPTPENPGLPGMEGCIFHELRRIRAINGAYLFMEPDAMPEQVSQSYLLQSTLLPPLEQSSTTVHGTQREFFAQEEEETVEREQGGGYIRLRVRIENGQMSVVESREVEGPLLQPNMLFAEFACEVTLGKKRIGIDSFSNPAVIRGYPNPRIREQRGHNIKSLSSYEFNVRVPRHELSFSDLPHVQVALYQVSEDALSQPIGPQPLAEQFGHELKEVARLNEIQVEKLPPRVQMNLRQALQ